MQKLLFLLYFIVFSNVLGAQNIDFTILQSTNIQRNTKLDNFFIGYTNSIEEVTIAAPILVYSIGVLKKNKTIQKAGIDMAIGAGINAAVTYGLKEIVKRPRPYVTYTQIQALQTVGNYSFPSGHSSASFHTATSIVMHAKDFGVKKWKLAIPAYTYSGLMAYSRLHAGVHYPSDIVTGAGLGVLSAWVSNKLTEKLQRKPKSAKAFDKLYFNL
jgi:membrane-associated phospholipid phosphatase